MSLGNSLGQGPMRGQEELSAKGQTPSCLCLLHRSHLEDEEDWESKGFWLLLSLPRTRLRHWPLHETAGVGPWLAKSLSPCYLQKNRNHRGQAQVCACTFFMELGD